MKTGGRANGGTSREDMGMGARGGNVGGGQEGRKPFIAPQPIYAEYFNPQVPTHQPSHVGSSQALSSVHGHTYPMPFDPDDMELELDLEFSMSTTITPPSTPEGSWRPSLGGYDHQLTQTPTQSLVVLI